MAVDCGGNEVLKKLSCGREICSRRRKCSKCQKKVACLCLSALREGENVPSLSPDSALSALPDCCCLSPLIESVWVIWVSGILARITCPSLSVCSFYSSSHLPFSFHNDAKTKRGRYLKHSTHKGLVLGIIMY